MRLRHGGRQNAPAREHRQRQAAAQQRRRQRRLQYREHLARQQQLDSVRQLLRGAAIIPESSLPPGLKIPPKGAPVPRQLRWYRPAATLYTTADVDTAAGLLDEVDLCHWPGPRQATTMLYAGAPVLGAPAAKLTRVWRVRHTEGRLQRICDIIRDHGAEPNVRRLYHGTATSSLVGIVKQGLLCGNHGMFGGGIYFAPAFVKAYGHTGWGEQRYVFTADVALGRSKEMEKSDTSLGAEIWEQGFQSVAGVRGMTTTTGKSTLIGDEFVVYYRDQVHLLYLAQFTLSKEPQRV